MVGRDGYETEEVSDVLLLRGGNGGRMFRILGKSEVRSVLRQLHTDSAACFVQTHSVRLSGDPQRARASEGLSAIKPGGPPAVFSKTTSPGMPCCGGVVCLVVMARAV